MKKRILLTLLSACMVLNLAACGSNTSESTEVTESVVTEASESAESTEASESSEEEAGEVFVLKDLNVTDYVTVPDYENLTVTVAAVSDDEVESLASYYYHDYITADLGGITDRAVENGDTVNISYVGTLDGEAFSGGTADGAELVIGSGTYIDGFEEGLVGVMPGETVDLNLTFPDPYVNNTDLSGAEVVFTTTVNFIIPDTIAVEDMHDEIIVLLAEDLGISDEVSNVDEYVAYMRTYLESSRDSEIEDAVIDALVDGSEYAEELPEGLVNQFKGLMMKMVETYASYYSIDADTYAYYYGYEDADSLTSDYADHLSRQYLAFQVIANEQDLNVSDEELDEHLEESVALYGYDSVEEFMEVAGYTNKEVVRDEYMYEKVLAYLVSVVNVNEAAE